jgi:hypothetical protein
MDDRDDLKMMQSPDEWPAWPRLPMKRYPADPVKVGFGVLVERMSTFEYAWLPGISIVDQIHPEDLIGKWFQRDNVAKLQEILDDGWIVD